MQESRVGKMLSDNTIKKVIIFVLLILICIPLLSLNLVDPVNAQAFGLNTFLELYKNIDINDPTIPGLFASNFSL